VVVYEVMLKVTVEVPSSADELLIKVILSEVRGEGVGAPELSLIGVNWEVWSSAIGIKLVLRIDEELGVWELIER
jgi:hypothetical protein